MEKKKVAKIRSSQDKKKAIEKLKRKLIYRPKLTLTERLKKKLKELIGVTP